ncbi:MAG: hypothetical protein GY814_06710, partial [Gammaproteobacteria bacterium]|nr:hypothetical protein [Gammaproteobacteria bacterium]
MAASIANPTTSRLIKRGGLYPTKAPVEAEKETPLPNEEPGGTGTGTGTIYKEVEPEFDGNKARISNMDYFRQGLRGYGRGGLLEHRGGTVTKSYADWQDSGGTGNWEDFVQEVHNLTPEQFQGVPDSIKALIYRGDGMGADIIKDPQTYFSESKMKFTSEHYENGEYKGIREGTNEQHIDQAARSTTQADRSVSQLFDREALNPLLEGAGGNGLVQSAKQNALTRSARTVQDTNRTLSRRGTQLTPAQRMAINNQLGLN